MERFISALGVLVMIFLAWLMSANRRQMNWRVIVGGLLLQFGFALLILKTTPGQDFFAWLGSVFTSLISFADEGSKFMFGVNARPNDPPLPHFLSVLRTFAFGVLPTIVFFSSLMSILYYLGVMQRVVAAVAWLMQKTLRTSGAETLSASANIFVGQTEAPLVIKPYVKDLTQSELMAVMVGGFATVAGGVMAAYISMGINAGHLVTASVISAPAALLIAKIMEPEVEQPKTAGKLNVKTEQVAINLIDAAAIGATDGMKLAINVGAMLIAFIALIAMLDGLLSWCGSFIGGWFGEPWHWSLSGLLGYLFWPLAWIMGIETRDCLPAGELLGKKMATNEFVAYLELGDWMQKSAANRISDRTAVILTYALCGFANFGSIGIQIGGIGGIAPDRRHDLARLGLRAMLGGTLACFMTACVVGILNPTWSESNNQSSPVKQESKAEKAAPSEAVLPLKTPTATSPEAAAPKNPAIPWLGT